LAVELWNDVDNWKNITNSQNSVRKKSFGGTFSLSNCHIIGLDTGSLVLIVFGDNFLNGIIFLKTHLKVLESVIRKDQAAQFFLFSGTILRGLTQPLNKYGYKYFSLLLLLFYPFVVPADLS
jgi:hypothetical protein